jgi:hypothetical protein
MSFKASSALKTSRNSYSERRGVILAAANASITSLSFNVSESLLIEASALLWHASVNL